MNFGKTLRQMLTSGIGNERKQMAITIPPVPEGIFNENDLCNQVYNENPELVNLRWDNPRFHLRLKYILDQVGGVAKEWFSPLNPSAPIPGATELRMSTMVRIEAFGVYDDFDVRNIFITPSSVVAMLWELANPRKIAPQRQPYNFDGESDAIAVTGDPIGAGWPDHPFAFNAGAPTGRKIFHPAAGDTRKVGETYRREDGDYVKINYWKVPASLSGGGVQAPVWERVYAR